METYNRPDRHRQNPGNRAIIGVVLLLAGFFLLLRNTNIFPVFIDDIIFSWQMLLIVIGLIITIGSSDKTPGIIVMAVGAFFLLPSLFSNLFGAYRLFWPAVFITLGIIVIFGGQRVSRKFFHRSDSGTDDHLDIVNVFSGSDRMITSNNFSGGEVTSVFGGNKIDLTRSTLAPGVSELEVTCVFGGTEIIVPEEWNVALKITPILGGFSDERKFSPGRTIDSTRQLVIKGTVIFGGGELKCY